MICNIVENRKRNYLWKRLNAVIEPTWHDNSLEGADKAEPSEDEVDCDERERISVADAVAWADPRRDPDAHIPLDVYFFWR